MSDNNINNNNHTRSTSNTQVETAEDFLFASAVLISLLALTCNALLICVIARSRLLKTPTNIFIASLAIGELIIGVFGIPFAAASVVAKSWPFSSSLCQMSASLQIIGRSSSTYSLMAVCIDRCLAVSKPLRYSHILTVKASSITLVLIWMLALVIGFLPLAGSWGSYRYARGYYMCTLFRSSGGRQHIVKEVICSYLPGLVIFISILQIVKEVKSHHRIFAIVQLPVTASINTPGELLPEFVPGPRGFNRNTSRAMRSLFIVTCGYAMFCLPLSILNILYQDRVPDIMALPVVTCIVWLSFLCCVINPVIIIVFNRKFRAQLKVIFNQHKCQPLGRTKEVFTITTGLHTILDATLVLNMVKHENASTTASIRRKIIRLDAPK